MGAGCGLRQRRGQFPSRPGGRAARARHGHRPGQSRCSRRPSNAPQAAGLANVTFAEGDAEDPGACPGWPPTSFDVVLAANVLQFLPRPAQAVATGCACWCRVARSAWPGRPGKSPGGTGDRGGRRARARRGARVRGVHAPPPIRCHLGGVEDMLTRAGYCECGDHCHLWPGSPSSTRSSSGGSPTRRQGPWVIAWRHIRPAASPRPDGTPAHCWNRCARQTG